jgi:hypothetical protein
MSDELFPFRNKANGLIGYLTHEQAAVFGDNYEELEVVVAPAPTAEEIAAEVEVAAAQVATAQAAADEAAAQAAADLEGETV